MMHPAWLSAITLCAPTLLVIVTLTSCDDSGADTPAPLTETTAKQATAETSLSVDATAVAQDTSPKPPTLSDPAPPKVSAEPKAVPTEPRTVPAEPTAVAANDPPPRPAEVKKPQSQQREPSTKPVDVTFDDIKLDLAKDEPFVEAKRTERLDQFDGERVRIRGFILPGYSQTGLKQFVLVRDNMQCCFGPGAALFDCIVVEMEGESTAEFSVRPVAVEGVFRVQELKDLDGRQLAIYHLAGENVR
jgi:hypothetical protein